MSRVAGWICLSAVLAIRAHGETLSITLTAPPPVIDGTVNGSRVIMAGFHSSGGPGQPDLPAQVFRIAVPPDIDWTTLKVRGIQGEGQALALPAAVAPATPDLAGAPGGVPAGFGAATNIVNGRDMDVYSLAAPYPASPVRLLPYGQMRKWKYAQVEFSPVQWNPATGAAQFWPKVQVELEFERSVPVADDALLADHAMDDMAETLLINFEQAAAWYAPTAKAQAEAEKSFVANYLIVTTTAITNNCPKLQEFIANKTALGNTVAVITETDFNAVVGQAPNHRAEKIRKWLMDHYISWGFSYVLLIGNPTPYENGEGDIPMKMTWPKWSDAGDREAPTDMFYGDLTGNWDINGNQIYGEWSDYTTAGGVNLTPEVYVGRIPVYGADYNGLRDVLQKIMDFDNEANVAWRKNILLPMSFSGAGYDGAPLAEQMWDDYLSARGYGRWRQYEQGNGACSPNSAYASDQELRGGNTVRDRWAANDYGIVCWWAHGNVDVAAVGYDGCWDGDLFKSSMTGSLDDNHPSFTFQCSCLNGYPEQSNNLQYQLLRRGAIGTVSSSRVSFFNTSYGYGSFNGASVNAGIGYEYVKRLTDGQTAGRALTDGKMAVVADIGSRNTRLMNQFDFNLYGDPASQVNMVREYFPLANNTPWTMTAVPRRYSFSVYSSDWAGVAIRPATEDHDLKVDTNVGLPSPYETSTISGVTPDFVVANGHRFGNGTHYAEVSYGDPTPYVIEAENNIVDLVLESWSARSLRTNDVMDLMEIPVLAGHTYEVSADVTSGTPDLMLFVFDPSRTSGSRLDYDGMSNTTGAGGDETLTYAAATSGDLAVLVIKANGVAGNYNLRVRDVSPLASPVACSASDGSASDRVSVSWSAVSGASHYRLYRHTVNDSAGASAMSGWIAGTSLDDFSAEIGTCYYYWVKAATDSAGFRASAFSPVDSGYVQPPTLVDDVKVNISNTPSFYQFAEASAYWVTVGVRQDNPADNWSLRLYSAPDFRTQLVSSAYVVPVDFVVVDRNHAPNVWRGIEAYRYSGSGSAALEFDGGNETLSTGTTAGILWPAGDVVEMRDINLTAGTYRITLTVTAGAANLDTALFGSGDGNYYRNREQYLARSTRAAGMPDVFYVSLTNADWYGLCVWANDTNSATYNIEVVPVMAGLWEGDVSEDWHTPGNWNNNAVPAAGNDVTIPPGTPFSPRVYRQAAYCSNLTVQAGATLIINTNELFAGGNSHIHGFLNMNSTAAKFHLGGDMVWESGSTASMIGSARILVTGDWNFEAGANVQLTSGYVEFEGPGISFIRCYDDNCNLFNLNCSKAAPNYLGVSPLCTQDLPINNLYIYGGTEFRCYSAYDVIIRGFMNNMGGVFQWPSGGAVFTGNPSAVPLNPTADSYFNNLVQSGTGPLVLHNTYTNYLRVARNVSIVSNAIDCASLGLWVGGNWTNEVGRAGFLCRTGSVTFTGSSSQYVYGSNIFHTIWDARGGAGTLWLNDDIVVSNACHVTTIHGVNGRVSVLGTLDLNSAGGQFAVYSGGNVTTAKFDQGGHLYLYGGQFWASDLVDNGLFGKYTIDEGVATLQQDAAQFIDLNANVDINHGTLRVVGGNGYSYWPFSTTASLRMTGGVLDFDGAGIRVHNNGYAFTNSITGGRIRTSGDFVGANTAFSPPSGEVELYGAPSKVLNLVAGSSLHSLIINKRAATVTAITNIVLTGNFTIDDGVFTAPQRMTVAGNWSNGVGAAGFVEGLGTVVFDGATPADILTDETFYNLEVNKSYSGFDALELADGIRVTVNNTLTCTNGTLEMNADSVLNVRGDMTLVRGAGLNANDMNTSLFVGGNWVNQNTNHTIYNGFDPGSSSRVTFDGTRTLTLGTDCPAEEFWDLVIDRPGGGLRPLDSVYVNGQLTISNGYWSSFVGGLQHHLRGNVYVHTGGAWGDSSPANTVWFTGGSDATINYAGTNGYFSNIAIDKAGGARVRLLSDILQLGGVGLAVVQGTYDLAGHLDRVTGGVTVGSNAVLIVDAGAELELGASSNLTVQAGGRLEVIGAAGNPATISRQSGNFSVLIQSNATIAARQAVFEYLNTDGVYVMDGATVDPGATFDDCTFRNGVAGGSLLRVENNQTFTAMRTIFSSNAGGGAANVRKSLNQGRVIMRDATGVFAGEAYDNDRYDRIDWGYGVLTSVSLDVPGYVTLGGRYDALASVAPGDASEPIKYIWTVTGSPAVQHVGGVSPDMTTVSWNTPGAKSIQVTASNQWGTVTATQAVLVEPLWISSLERQLVGTNLTVRLVIKGTTPHSQYEIQSTPSIGLVPWTPILPHGSGWPGSETNTIWFDHSDGDRIIESFTNLFYRARVLLPDIAP